MELILRNVLLVGLQIQINILGIPVKKFYTEKQIHTKMSSYDCK